MLGVEDRARTVEVVPGLDPLASSTTPATPLYQTPLLSLPNPFASSYHLVVLCGGKARVRAGRMYVLGRRGRGGVG